MSSERRYGEGEIRKIFELAIRGDDVDAPNLSNPDGLTLAELQNVGREIGLEPERVARAAWSLDSPTEMLPRQTTLGLPTSVGRVVELPRPVTDREWELIVAELRKTFGTKGELTTHGTLREWSSGNTHAFIEPTESGYQLRLNATNSEFAVSFTALGGFFLLFALLLLVILLGKDDPGTRYVVPVFFALLGGGALATNVVGLPRWASTREKQLQSVATRVKALMSSTEEPD